MCDFAGTSGDAVCINHLCPLNCGHYLDPTTTTSVEKTKCSREARKLSNVRHRLEIWSENGRTLVNPDSKKEGSLTGSIQQELHLFIIS